MGGGAAQQVGIQQGQGQMVPTTPHATTAFHPPPPGHCFVCGQVVHCWGGGTSPLSLSTSIPGIQSKEKTIFSQKRKLQ